MTFDGSLIAKTLAKVFNVKCLIISFLIYGSLNFIDVLVFDMVIDRHVKAILDNSGHAWIAGLSWLMVRLGNTINHRELIFEVFISSIIGSIIDLDHFIEAEKLTLKVSKGSLNFSYTINF